MSTALRNFALNLPAEVDGDLPGGKIAEARRRHSGGPRLLSRDFNRYGCAPGLILDDARLPAHFWSKVEPEPNSGCWLWIANSMPLGYGAFCVHRKSTMAHRVAYEAAHGRIGDGLHLDHLCRNPACINPAHLEPVTPRENVRRGVSRAARALRRSTCVVGHPYDPANTYRFRGYRLCRACRADNQRAYLRRKGSPR